MLKYGKVFKSGNSLALYISKEVIDEIGLKNGDYVKSELVDGKIIVTKVEA